MEQMNIRRLYIAATAGDSASLLNLLASDPLLLDRFIETGPYCETPLHIASLLGHLEFVTAILDQKPDLASKIDPQRSSPLHMAAAGGRVDIVKKLLACDPEMCFVRDRSGKNPLHVATVMGHVEVLKELMHDRPLASRDKAEDGKTILHLSVKYKKWEALKFLLENMNDHEFANSKDYDGNTILHLTATYGQKEMIQYLITTAGIQVHTRNLNGFTAFNILARSERPEEEPPSENNTYQQIRSMQPSELDLRSSRQLPEPGVLMVVASLIATMAFQAAIDPPGGNLTSIFDSFVLYNTTALIASMSIILLLISGFSILRRRAFLWIYMVFMWVAISSLSLVYCLSLSAMISGLGDDYDVGEKPSYTLMRISALWSLVMLLLLPGHLILQLVKFIQRKTKGRLRSLFRNIRMSDINFDIIWRMV